MKLKCERFIRIKESWAMLSITQIISFILKTIIYMFYFSFTVFIIAPVMLFLMMCDRND